MVCFMGSSFEYCRKIVRDSDYDRYLISLFGSRSEALWALFAFHYEIAKTRFVVSEPTLGLIRLQWWRDEIAKIYSGQVYAAGEVLNALASVIRAHDLPQEWFEAMLVAREAELRDEVPSDVQGALAYLEMVQSPLLRAAVRICGEESEGEPLAAVALNYGVMDAIRRAEKHSLVAQNFDAFEAAFQKNIRCESRVLRAVQGVSDIWMKCLRVSRENGRAPRVPPLLALKLWTKMLWL